MSDEAVGAENEADQTRVITAMGKEYAVADKIGLGPLIRFRMLAKQGADSADSEALDVMVAMLMQALTDEAWLEFQDDMMVHRIDHEDIFEIVKDAIEIITARPTSRPSVSSAGPTTTTASSTEPSSFGERKRALGLVPVIEGMSELAG